MEIQIKKLYELVDSPFVLDTQMTYPTIPESTANFLTDYNTSKAIYDRYFLKEHGNKFVEVDGDEEEDVVLNWKKEIQAIQRIYLDSWAHMYYALDIAYNPVYNVEEHIETQYGAHETDREYGATQNTNQYGATQDTKQYGATQDTMQYGATQDTTQYGATQDTTQYGATKDTTQYGATSDTLGTHTDTRTNYSVSFDGTTEKETGKQSDVIGSQTNTSLTHTDTVDSIQHSDVASSIQHSDVVSSIQHSDVASSIQHTDTASSLAHTDTLSALAHTDKETSKLHTDTVDRTGNIGIKSASALAQEEVLLRERNIFFKGIFLTISREVGAYYDNYFI